MRAFIILFILHLLTTGIYAVGTISGKVIDGKTGETLIGVSVFIENTTIGAATDLDGNFVITNAPAGKHNVVMKYIGYKPKVEKDIAVEDGKITILQSVLETDEVTIKEVVVTSDIVKHDNASAIALMQKNSTVIQSGISSEEIRKSPDKNSSDVLKRVTGAVISEGKYAVIRGLADRYNMALVNGQMLPSTEPDKKTFAFDIFPSNMLDNMLVYKTAQPDLPSEFAGGIINMNTKDIPEKNFFNLAYTNTFTQHSTFQRYKTYEGGKYDAIGFDDGGRQLAAGFPMPDSMRAWNKFNPKRYDASKKLPNKWSSRDADGVMYPGQSVQVSGGFAKKLKDIEMGGVFALNYGNNLRQQEIISRQQIATTDTDWVYDETRYINNTQLGALANVALQIKGQHKIALKTFFNQSSEDITAVRSERDVQNNYLFIRDILQFTATNLWSTQLTGDHFFKGSALRMRWYGGYTQTHRDQPMTRGISYRFYNDENDEADTMVRVLAVGLSASPLSGGLFFADLKDKQYNAGFDFAVPFKLLAQKQTFKTGFYFLQKERTFTSRIMGYTQGPQFNFMRMFDSFDNAFDTANMNMKGYVLDETTNNKESYSASSQTAATYAMLDNKFTAWLRVIWGVRFEYFRQQLNSYDQSNAPAMRDNKYYNVLPSANFIFSLNDKMNVRASYSITTSRPEFRELVDNAYFDFTTNYSITGNPNLTQTRIHNADMRYEIFWGKGQMFSASAFYKRLRNPIELLAQAGTSSVQAFAFSNQSTAHLGGGEVEVKKNLDFIPGWKQWENFSVSFNAAYIYSSIQITDSNVAGRRNRALYGQAPYVINAALQYNNPQLFFSCGLLFNISGPKIFAVSGLNEYDIYENARPQLDFTISKGFLKNKFLVRFTAGDLIAVPTVRYFNAPTENKNFNGTTDEVFGIWKNYRTFSLTLGYSF